ncbi:protein of unknown function [Methylocaldum szegediense]|uniref:Uncharacterized protein n=1 Tax=Methylocaldum szegediense TaxID=73780 RepID=A0ABM9I963_9GAMM|nr:protein of unknown function [Methylocaldum szegediense]
MHRQHVQRFNPLPVIKPGVTLACPVRDVKGHKFQSTPGY